MMAPLVLDLAQLNAWGLRPGVTREVALICTDQMDVGQCTLISVAKEAFVPSGVPGRGWCSQLCSRNVSRHPVQSWISTEY